MDILHLAAKIHAYNRTLRLSCSGAYIAFKKLLLLLDSYPLIKGEVFLSDD